MPRKKEAKRRRKGIGSIFAINGNYYYKYSGKKIALGTKSKDEAEKIVEEKYLPNLDAQKKTELLFHIGEQKKLINQKKLPLKDVFKEYLDSPKRKDNVPKTLREKESRWNKFVSTLSPFTKYFSEITEKDVEDFFKQLKKNEGKRPRTLNVYIEQVGHIFKVLLKNEDNPFKNIEKVDAEVESKKEFSDHQLIAIFSAFDIIQSKQLPLIESERALSLKVKPPLYLMHKEETEVLFHMANWTGQRLKDCALMEWEHVYFNKNKIGVLPYKTKSKKPIRFNIPIHPILEKQLTKATQWKKDGFVLPKIAERYGRNPTGVNDDCMKVLIYAGLEVNIKKEGRERATNIYGFHSFKHSFVSYLINAGESYAIIEALVGTGSPILKRHYTHIQDKTLEKAIGRLPKSIKKITDYPESEIIEVKDKIQETRDRIIQAVNSIEDIEALEIIFNAIIKKEKTI